jgi:hypothetical protein
LLAVGEVLTSETGQSVIDPTKLIAPMLPRFMATDRVFAKTRRRCSRISGKYLSNSRMATAA